MTDLLIFILEQHMEQFDSNKLIFKEKESLH